MRLVDRGNGLRRVSARLLMACFGVALLHHADHVLRVDHSGWPFRQIVTPFTFSLFAYPVLLFALVGPLKLFWWRWAGLAAGTMLTLYAHAAIESPQMQYAMWAFDRSLDPALWDVRNLCGVRSGTLGVAAVLVSMLLNVLLVTTTIAMLSDGLRRRTA